MKSIVLKICVFIILLLITNLFLLKDGLWLYQDASYWYKNLFEIKSALSNQLHAYSRDLYYLGFDPGLFNFTHIITIPYIYLLIFIFGSSTAQIIFILSGYIFAFISFYYFLKIFFKDNNFRYILSLIYVFNPLMYSFQSLTIINAAIPLYIYSIYMYLQNKKIFNFKYLLLNIIATFLIIWYIRFIQISFFLIIVYLFYLFISQKIIISFKKILILGIFYILCFAPVLYSSFIQIIEKSDTAFYYGEIFTKGVSKINFYYVFDLLRSYDLKLFENNLYIFLGMSLFIFIIFILTKTEKKYINNLYIINLFLILFGITCFGLANIFGDDIYKSFISYLPFIINAPWWSLYIINIPLIILIGIITIHKKQHLYIYSSIFLLFSISPYIFYSQNVDLQKFKLSKLPDTYKEYFLVDEEVIPVATNYIPGSCWRAMYMVEGNLPTHCINFGYRYSPIAYPNPRLVTGKNFAISQLLQNSSQLENFRITHNLKNIIVPNDAKVTHEKNLDMNDNNVIAIINAKKNLDKNTLLKSDNNPNFKHYNYRDSDKYDFLLYAPKKAIPGDMNTIFKSTIEINERPVILEKNIKGSTQNINIFYKTSPSNPAKYYIQLSNVNTSKPFIIQMDQTYYPSWKLVWVDKAYFDRIDCLGNIKNFPITNNQYCQYKSNILEFEDIKLMTKKQIDDRNHIQGNLVGNTWIVSPKDIPEMDSNKDKLYAVIVFQKQLYYGYMVIISLLAFSILIALSIISGIKERKSISP